jgi:hypothetical protein
MPTMHRRRQWRDRRTTPMTLEELQASNRAIGILCAMAGIGLVFVVLAWLLGQPFFNAILGE